MKRCLVALLVFCFTVATAYPQTPPPTPPTDKKADPATEPEKKEEKKWDVMNPPGPASDVAIDVSEGTWMSLDVSPDGKEIAFDLLGDLYVLPIANPLENIRNTHSVRYTMVNGRLFDAATMNEIGNHPRPRKPFFFQVQGNETWGAAAAEAIGHVDQ